MPEPWPAPTARGAVDATVAVPGSKSMTNRALVIGALADGETTLSGALRSRDTELMAAGLRRLSVAVATDGDAWQVTGSADTLRATVGTAVDVDVGNAGTVARFLPPLAALTNVRVRFDGDA
ncbi:MAG: 3-phosphoshikimate 1-carboxyvinyltransferase, partial [Frankia sp.]|nr:3-phosphoshikimate 1-carboxyvinyltransferase [Frankia sp.]